MSRFSELMNRPLPSAFMESDMEGAPTGEVDDVIDAVDDVVDPSTEDLSQIDPDDLDDLEDLDDIEDDDDDLDDVVLTDDEAAEADNFMSLAATPTILKSELTEASEMKKFAESVDMDIAINEGFLLTSEREALLDIDPDLVEMTEAVKFAPKTKVMFSKEDRKKQLFWVGIFASAKAHNDKDYWILQKLYRMEREKKAKLKKRYKSEALKRVKIYIERLRKSNSNVLSKIADKITGRGNQG